MKVIVKIIIQFIFVSNVYAESIFDTKYAKELCKNSASSNDATRCSFEKYEYVEALLNKEYKELHEKLKDKANDEYYSERSRKKYADIEHLHKISQRSWIKFRENECSAVKTWYRGGKLQHSLYYDCMRSIAEKRIDDFKSFNYGS